MEKEHGIRLHRSRENVHPGVAPHRHRCDFLFEGDIKTQDALMVKGALKGTIESDNLIVYKKIIQFDHHYTEMEFHFDKDLNLLKYQKSYEGRTKGSSIINTITAKTYTLIIYPSKEVSIEIPKNVENNVDDLNTNLSIKDIFMNINGLRG